MKAAEIGYNEGVKRTIFVVEDDADIAGLVRHHLEDAAFGVRTFARDCRRISAMPKKAPPCLFLLDIMLPGGDGLELCQRIRSMPNLAAVPVIFLTAKSAEADRVTGLELGADDYVSQAVQPPGTGGPRPGGTTAL